MKVSRTRTGLRLSQHGVVISELRTSPGPTHSVFDLLAALAAELAPSRSRVGILGFAGGGMMAPLRGLGFGAPIESVDLDRTSYDLFRRHCGEWAGKVRWEQADVVEWLRRQRTRFGLLMDDLSVPEDGDVTKPEVSWTVLPDLMRRRLSPGGLAVFNLLPPANGSWRGEVARVAGRFKSARIVELEEYENRILVAGNSVPAARELGVGLRRALRELGSRQAARVRIRSLH